MKLNIETKGSPSHPAVLCLHGILGAARNLWRMTESIATQGFYVVSYDQRGHGRSEWAQDQDYSLETLAQDALSVLDSQGIDQAHFIGHSMGGRVSLAAYARDPQRFRSLSLLDVGVRIHAPAVQELESIVQPLPLSFASKEDALDTIKHHSAVMQMFLMSNLKQAGPTPSSFKWMFDLEGIRKTLLIRKNTDQSEIFKSLTIPLLVLRGETSIYLSQKDLEELKSLNPLVEIHTIPRAGHWLHVENLEDTLKNLITFLRSR